MKSKEELTALKKEVKALNDKLAMLTEDELIQVTGGEYTALSPKKKKKKVHPTEEPED